MERHPFHQFLLEDLQRVREGRVTLFEEGLQAKQEATRRRTKQDNQIKKDEQESLRQTSQKYRASILLLPIPQHFPPQRPFQGLEEDETKEVLPVPITSSPIQCYEYVHLPNQSRWKLHATSAGQVWSPCFCQKKWRLIDQNKALVLQTASKLAIT